MDNTFTKYKLCQAKKHNLNFYTLTELPHKCLTEKVPRNQFMLVSHNTILEVPCAINNYAHQYNHDLGGEITVIF